MNRLDEGQLRKVYDEVVSAAKELAAGQVSFVDGIRRVAAMRWLASPIDHDPDFMLFVGIDSESDHLPGIENRPQCAQAWLDQCDKEARELESFWSAEVRTACAVLVARFSG